MRECLHATTVISLFYSGTFSVTACGCRQIAKPRKFHMSIFLLPSLILCEFIFTKKLISETRLVDLVKVNASIAKVDIVKFDVSIFLLSYLILHKWVYFHKNWYQSSRLVNLMEVNASISKVDVIEIGNFRLW